MQSLSKHLFWIEDTCSVYLLERGGKGLLIDCGTDLRPHTLISEFGPAIAPENEPGFDPAKGMVIEKLLLTHFHRDQCAGAAQWQAAGAGVVIPFAERRFLEEADLLRAGYDIFDNYTAYYPTSGPPADARRAAY